MHLYRTQISKIVAFIFIVVTLAFSVYAFDIFRDLRKLQKTEIELFQKSQLIDSHFRQFQRALGFGGIIHNIKEYLIHRDEDTLFILSMNVKELQHSYAQLREHLQHNPLAGPSLAKTDRFVMSFGEKLNYLKTVGKQEVSAEKLDEQLGLESPELLSAIVTIESLMSYGYQLSIQNIRNSIDRIVKDLVIVCSILPFTLISGLFLAWSLRESNRDKMRLEKATEEQKKLHTELRQSHKMEAVGIMAGGIAHNFNNNLAVILGNLEIAQTRLKPDNKVSPCLEKARIGVYRSRDLVRKILSYSRQAEQKVESIRFTEIIEESFALLQSTIPSSIKLQKQISNESQKVYVNADASQIGEILLNLCNNAVNAMGEKGTLNIGVEKVVITSGEIPVNYTCAPGYYVRLSVEDSGSGIPDDIREKIFDPFFTTNSVHEGTGLGLATVQGVVIQHGGFIIVDSYVGKGTTFKIYLPSAPESVAEKVAEHESNTLSGGDEHILYVDDELMLAELGEEMLTTAGYEVSIVSDSTEALKLFRENSGRIDMLITDQTMPGLTGIELISEMKKVKPELPVILCTGHSSMVTAENAQDLGVDAYLEKPLDQEQLLRAVREVLAGKNTPNLF